MRPTEILMQEHRVIEQVLDCLEAMAQKCKESGELDTDSVKQAIDFFKNFADRCHHFKEEDCLFPLLESKGFSQDQGPTGVMLQEHDTGRLHVQEMAKALDTIAAGNDGPKPDFVLLAFSFVQLLREHIQKEDHCLFQMADQALSEQDQQKLLDAFAKVERDDLGPGTHEKYLLVAKQLAERYGIRCRVSEISAETPCCGHQ